jgi:hypothetical protein
VVVETRRCHGRLDAPPIHAVAALDFTRCAAVGIGLIPISGSTRSISDRLGSDSKALVDSIGFGADRRGSALHRAAWVRSAHRLLRFS